MTDYEVPRDRWGRPMLWPVREAEKREPYVRASTLAKALDDKSSLVDWKAGMAMLGLMRSKALQARVGAMAARGGGWSEHKKPLGEVTEAAVRLGGASDAADHGTAFHELGELVDAGQLDWAFVPDALKGPLEAYAEVMSALEVLDSEVFVAVDGSDDGGEFFTAGSLDRLVRVDGEVMVADLKTGAREPQYPLGVTCQTAIYSRGVRYQDSKFKGVPEDLEKRSWVAASRGDGEVWRAPLHPELSLERGLLIHCPLDRVRGKFRCDLYLLDLEHGWRAVESAVDVRALRKVPKLEKVSV